MCGCRILEKSTVLHTAHCLDGQLANHQPDHTIFFNSKSKRFDFELECWDRLSAFPESLQEGSYA